MLIKVKSKGIALCVALALTVKVKVDKTALKIAVDLANAVTDKDLEKVIPVVANEFKAARDEANAVVKKYIAKGFKRVS